MKLRYDYKLKEFKNAFARYLKKTHPNWTIRSVETRVSDAFILFRWYPEELAWELTITEGENIEYLRSDIESMLSHRAHYKKDTSGYIRAIKELQEFVLLVSDIENAKKLKPRTIHVKTDTET